MKVQTLKYLLGLLVVLVVPKRFKMQKLNQLCNFLQGIELFYSEIFDLNVGVNNFRNVLGLKKLSNIYFLDFLMPF